MGFVARNKESDFVPVPQGTHIAICSMLVDVGLQANPFKPTKKQAKIIVGWELPNELLEDGRAMHVSSIYTVSLHKKATLRKDLEGWRGKAFTEPELEGFDIRNLLGKPCQLAIVHKESEDRTYANVSGIMAIPKGMTVPKMVGELLIYSVDEHDEETFQKLPEWIQEMAKKGERPGQAEEEMTDRQNEIMETSGALPEAPPF